MRLPIWVLCVPIWLLAAGETVSWAQTPSGTLQPPAKPQHSQPHDQPATAPSAAPRTPVQKAGQKPGSATPAKVPVVPPHGPVHPEKPKTTPAKPSAAVPLKPPPSIPPNPPATAEPTTAPAEKPPEPEKLESAAAKLPRFASLRSDDVNMRAGPGTRYRIDWVYRRRDLPVEIEREFDVWRWVRDPDGIQGWVHQATLMGRRSFIVQKAEATLRSDANDASSAVAILKPGVIGRIRSCAAGSDWCEVQTGSYRGYLRRQAFWGLLPDEAINP
jgi:SH3-like domain-containing protein